MFIPFIPLLATLAAALGLGTLWWYDSLNKEEREKADRLAGQYAAKLFGKAVNELNRNQFQQVLEFVKRHFDE